MQIAKRVHAKTAKTRVATTESLRRGGGPPGQPQPWPQSGKQEGDVIWTAPTSRAPRTWDRTAALPLAIRPDPTRVRGESATPGRSVAAIPSPDREARGAKREPGHHHDHTKAGQRGVAGV